MCVVAWRGVAWCTVVWRGVAWCCVEWSCDVTLRDMVSLRCDGSQYMAWQKGSLHMQNELLADYK